MNQLRVALYDIRTECLKYQSDQSASELRKCPHCGHVWAKVEGCEDETTCGNRPSTRQRYEEARVCNLKHLYIYLVRWQPSYRKSGEKKVSSNMDPNSRGKDSGAGCGKPITWKLMPKADVPPEFCAATKISTDDIKVLPPKASDFQHELSGMIKMVKYSMKLSEPR